MPVLMVFLCDFAVFLGWPDCQGKPGSWEVDSSTLVSAIFIVGEAWNGASEFNWDGLFTLLFHFPFFTNANARAWLLGPEMILACWPRFWVLLVQVFKLPLDGVRQITTAYYASHPIKHIAFT